MENKIKLFLVDDHKMFLEGIFLLLDDEPDFDILGSAKNGEEALIRIKSLKPDIIISDIEMPKMNGFQLAKAIKEHDSNAKIIMVSSYSDTIMIEKAKREDIDGYLLKNTGRLELLTAIKKVYKGENYFSKEIIRIHNNSLFSRRKKKQNKVVLSPRELDVLKHIFQEMSTQEIAEELHISINTVDTHRKNLMRKIGAKNMVGLVKYAIQQGLI